MEDHHWKTVAAGCRQLAHSNYQRFCDLLDAAPLCPITDEFLGQMCSIQVRTINPEGLQRKLFEQYRIEVPVMRQDSHIFLRYSIQGYNNQDDLDRLFEALQEIRKDGALLQ